MKFFCLFELPVNRKRMFDLPYLTWTRQHEKVIHSIEKCGADVNERDSSGCTSLFIACKNYKLHSKLIHFLLSQENINVNLQNEYGLSPLHATITRIQSDVDLADAIDCVLLLLQDGRVDPNLITNDGSTPLMQACNPRSNVVLIKLMLASGRWIDVEKRTMCFYLSYLVKSEMTALDLAMFMRRGDAVSFLQQYKSNPMEMQKIWRKEMKLKGLFAKNKNKNKNKK